jgi:putative tryptophan/tyrosine transport system substrate-binding protein
MKRREFITLLGGAVAWPLPASAPRTPKLPTIGFSSPTTASVENQRVAAFVQRLRAVGWIEGRTVAIKVRWAEGRSERAAEIVAEFVRQSMSLFPGEP